MTGRPDTWLIAHPAGIRGGTEMLSLSGKPYFAW